MGTRAKTWLRLALALCGVLVGFVPALATTDTVPVPDLLLIPYKVWTGDEDQTHRDWAVLIHDDKIVAVGPIGSIHAPAGAASIHMPNATLLPGLMDLHSHLLLHPYNEMLWNDQVLKESEAYRTLQAAEHARLTVWNGFTTLRDLGTEGAGYADVALKQAINEGWIEGPRLFVATRAIVATDAYGPGPKGFRPDLDLPQGAQAVSGVDEMLRAVREQIGHGADWIKLYADYRWTAEGDARPTLTLAEMKAAVEVAHAAGKPVAVHATTDAGMRLAIEAGVDTIEHGYGGSLDTFKLMKQRGIAYLPTLTAAEAYSEYFEHYERGKSLPTERMKLAASAFHNALAAGVTIGCGSDVGVFAHGTNRREIQWMARLGMSNAQALRAATVVDARILGKQNELGRIAPGYDADLVAVVGEPLDYHEHIRNSNPVDDLEALAQVSFVLKGGRIYRTSYGSGDAP